MKLHLLGSVAGFVCLLCSAGAAAAGPAFLCNLSGTVGTQITNWQMWFPGFESIGTNVGSGLNGSNLTTGALAWGVGSLPNGNFPVTLAWTENLSPGNQSVRHLYITLGTNLQGSGSAMIISTASGAVSTSNVTIASASCTPA